MINYLQNLITTNNLNWIEPFKVEDDYIAFTHNGKILSFDLLPDGFTDCLLEYDNYPQHYFYSVTNDDILELWSKFIV